MIFVKGLDEGLEKTERMKNQWRKSTTPRSV